MKIKLRRVKRTSVNIEDILFAMIVMLIFASACFDVIYQRAPAISIEYNRLFRNSIYGLVVICILKLLIDVAKTRKLNHITVLMLLMFLYGAFVTWIQGLFSLRALVVDNLAWILVFCVSYCYANRREINQIVLNPIFIIGTMVYCMLMMININMHIMGFDPRGGTVSSLYYCFGIIGLVLLCLPKSWKRIFSIVMGLMVLFSTKRTGVFVILIGFFFYFVGQASIEGRLVERVKKYVRIIFIIIAACLVALWFIEKYDIRILDRLATITTDGGSGRDEIWKSVLFNYKRSDVLHKIFGYGFHAVPELLRPFNRYLFAHNGFLEVLFDFGILGLIAMVSGIVWLGINTMKMQKEKHLAGPVMLYSMIVIILLSLFSYLFEESRFVMPVALVCGLCMGRYKKKR